MQKAIIHLVGFAVVLPAYMWAQSVPAQTGVAYFETHIRPLLAANCYGCHSAKLPQPMGGLLLDSRAGMLRGGKSGVPVIIAGKPEESLLFAAVVGAVFGYPGPAHAPRQDPGAI